MAEARRPAAAALATTAVQLVLEKTAGSTALTRLAVLQRVRDRLEGELLALSGLEDQVRRLTHQIGEVTEPAQLAHLHSLLNGLAARLFESDHSVTELLELCTACRDLIFIQTLRRVEAELGPLPCAYAVGSMGDEGRREQTIHTDQDNMIIYQADDARGYFRRFACLVNERLDAAGLHRCKGGIMMCEPAWQGTLGDWQRRIDHTFAFRGLDREHKRQLLDLMILSDLRFIHGSRALLQRLTSYFFSNMYENVPVLYDMATACVAMPVGVGLFGRFKTESDGPNRGRFNIKLLGWAPLILAVRVMALKENVYETNTLARIEALRLHHRIDDATAADLAAAYTLLTRLKIQAQIGRPAADDRDPYQLDPDDLPDAARSHLRQALHSVEALQNIAYHSFQFGS